MSVYTTEVRFICETYAGKEHSQGYDSINEILEKSWDKVFENFPLFDETYRKYLCCKILKHFYEREICAETVGLWKLMLNRRMEEIMPYYNKLYEAETLKYDPLHDIDYVKEIVGDNTRTGSTTTSTTTNSTDDKTIDRDMTNRYSDTPQGSITDLAKDKYLTNATIRDENEKQKDNFTGITNGIKDDTAKSNNSERTKMSGKMSGKSYSELIIEYRKSMINIDMKIINELNDLFFNLY